MEPSRTLLRINDIEGLGHEIPGAAQDAGLVWEDLLAISGLSEGQTVYLQP